MNTTMVRQSGTTPMSSVETGADAIMQLAVSPRLEGRSGLYFNVMNETPRQRAGLRSEGPRAQLRKLSLELTGLKSGAYRVSPPLTWIVWPVT